LDLNPLLNYLKTPVIAIVSLHICTLLYIKQHSSPSKHIIRPLKPLPPLSIILTHCPTDLLHLLLHLLCISTISRGIPAQQPLRRQRCQRTGYEALAAYSLRCSRSRSGRRKGLASGFQQLLTCGGQFCFQVADAFHETPVLA
jgi:hypothetical protein